MVSCRTPCRPSSLPPLPEPARLASPSNTNRRWAAAGCAGRAPARGRPRPGVRYWRRGRHCVDRQWALSPDDVMVITVDKEPQTAALAARGAWPQFVDLRMGDALGALGESGAFDLIFADAPGGKWAGLDRTITTLRPHGLLVVRRHDRHPGMDHRAARQTRGGTAGPPHQPTAHPGRTRSRLGSHPRHPSRLNPTRAGIGHNIGHPVMLDMQGDHEALRPSTLRLDHMHDQALCDPKGAGDRRSPT
jgi:hypothetical protein